MPDLGPTRAAPAPRSSTSLVIASFVPLGFAIVLGIVAPGFYEPLLDDQLRLIGTRLIVPFAGALLGLLVIDFLVIGFVRSSFVQGIILALTTTAGVFVVILVPAFARVVVALSGAVD